MSGGNLYGVGPGALLPAPGRGRASFYWTLPDYLPLPEGWVCHLQQRKDGSLLLTSGSELSVGPEDDGFVAQVSFHHLASDTDATILSALSVARAAGLPHSTGDHTGREVPEWAAFEISDEATTETEGEDQGTTSLSHITVAHMVAALDESPSAAQVGAAFEQCLELLHCTHQGLHAVTGLGYGLPRAESEQLGILVGLDVLSDMCLQARWPLGLYLIADPWRHQLDRLSATQLDALPRAELDAVQNSARSVVFDLQREAVAAARRTGDTRAAIVMAATACEAWTDLLLGCLLWEEGLTPEEACAEYGRYRDALERLNRLLAPRLGGNWDAKRQPALAAWRQDVAEARNFVVHAGASPKQSTALAAIDAMYGFLRFTLDRLCAPATRNRFPIAALLLAQRIGLEQRDGWSRRMKQAADEADPLDLPGVFGRWYSAVAYLRTPPGLRPSGQDADAISTLVRLLDGRIYWTQHDRRGRLARLATPETSDDEHLAALQKINGATSITVSFDDPPLLRPNGEWLPEHRLLPRVALMRDPALWDTPDYAPADNDRADSCNRLETIPGLGLRLLTRARAMLSRQDRGPW